MSYSNNSFTLLYFIVEGIAFLVFFLNSMESFFDVKRYESKKGGYLYVNDKSMEVAMPMQMKLT